MNPFYVLWNPASKLPPKVMFDSLVKARFAAEQMANKHPGETFHVMQTMGSVVKSDVSWTYPDPF